MFKVNNSSRNPSLGARDRNWEFMLHNFIKIFLSELAFPLKRESEASNSRVQCRNVEQKTFFHFQHKFLR
jgi:hypothetical protein